MLSYLLEIGCEELPASFVNSSLNYLKEELAKQLRALNISHKEISGGGTPRRLYIYIDELNDTQTDKTEFVMGPPAKIAFNDDGSLTDTAKKFAETKGLELKSLKKISTPKGDYLQGEKKTGGEKTSEILKRLLPEIIRNIPFPKSMRWGDNELRFARPIHWILSLLGSENLSFELGGIKSGVVTYGHRFLAPEMIIAKNFEQYKADLKKAFVVVDFEERVKIIKAQFEKIEHENDVHITKNEDLLSTVANLLEYPHSIIGEFESTFLALPQEVLITSMKIHQKYFPINNKKGELLNKFIGVANIVPKSGDKTISKGYARVLRARLNDALFFYNNDKNTSLEAMAEKLKKVVYQEKLGTIHEKVERFKNIAVWLGEKYAPDELQGVKETALLAKADLMSEMVYEFPELQGTMGCYYAKIEGKPENISKGIAEHYLPKFAGGELPSTWTGRLVSIADKMDTIAGSFASGNIPTGNVDPYGIRRSTIGILSIIEDAKIRLDLNELIEKALENFETKLKFDKEDIAQKILNFFLQRYKQILATKDAVDADVFDAVAYKSGDILVIKELAKVLTVARGSESFQVIAGSFKRINNILKKTEVKNKTYDKSLFETEEEKSLADMIEKQHIGKLIKEEKFYDALDELMRFAPVLSAFFDKVMVMAEDTKVRENRLALISSLRDIFNAIGNLEVIS